MARLALLLLLVPFGVAAANNDDGFVWVDANTKIKLAKPGSITPASAASGGSAEPKKGAAKQKKEKNRRQ